MDHESVFWSQAERYLTRPGVTRSTMMGLPGLRIDGAFFGSFDRETGDLLVKLPAERVNALVATGEGKHFSPAGKTFREWVAISAADEEHWTNYLDEALEFAASQPRN